jgi:hypothetical protein
VFAFVLLGPLTHFRNPPHRNPLAYHIQPPPPPPARAHAEANHAILATSGLVDSCVRRVQSVNTLAEISAAGASLRLFLRLANASAKPADAGVRILLDSGAAEATLVAADMREPEHPCRLECLRVLRSLLAVEFAREALAATPAAGRLVASADVSRLEARAATGDEAAKLELNIVAQLWTPPRAPASSAEPSAASADDAEASVSQRGYGEEEIDDDDDNDDGWGYGRRGGGGGGGAAWAAADALNRTGASMAPSTVRSLALNDSATGSAAAATAGGAAVPTSASALSSSSSSARSSRLRGPLGRGTRSASTHSTGRVSGIVSPGPSTPLRRMVAEALRGGGSLPSSRW